MIIVYVTNSMLSSMGMAFYQIQSLNGVGSIEKLGILSTCYGKSYALLLSAAFFEGVTVISFF